MKKIEKKIRVQIPQKLERILLYVGGLFLVLLVYVLVFSSMQLKNQELDLHVSKLETEKAQLLDMKNHQKEHANDTEKMKKEIASMLKTFPAENKEEDAIMFATNLEDKTKLQVYDIYFAGKNLIQQGEASGYVLYSNPVEYNYQSGYTSLKKSVSAILKAGAKKNVENITLSYDSSTGTLQGSMTVNEFSIEGNGQEYAPVEISGVEKGNQNPFAAAN